MVVAVVDAAAAAVDDGDGVDVEDGCVDGAVGTAAAAAAGVVDFVAFQALAFVVVVVVVVVVVDLHSSCLPGVLALEAWFERDTKAFC